MLRLSSLFLSFPLIYLLALNINIKQSSSQLIWNPGCELTLWTIPWPYNPQTDQRYPPPFYRDGQAHLLFKDTKYEVSDTTEYTYSYGLITVPKGDCQGRENSQMIQNVTLAGSNIASLMVQGECFCKFWTDDGCKDLAFERQGALESIADDGDPNINKHRDMIKSFSCYGKG